MSDIKHPEVKVELVGQDGNAFSILGRCRNACRKYLPKETWESIYHEFSTEAKSGDYNHLLCTVMDFFTVDEDYEEEDESESDDDWCVECGCSPCECDEICHDCGKYLDNCSCDDDNDEIEENEDDE